MDWFNLIVIVLGLAMFETIASIDNAVINAEVLTTMQPKARKWSGYWSRRLRGYGANGVANKMRRIVLHYPQLEKQTAFLELIRFVDKHAELMDYQA